MDYTAVKLHSYSVNVNTETAQIGYRIDATCTEAGELPTTRIFAYEIGDVDDPSADKFHHVATIHEIQTVYTDRDAAIAAGADYYFLTFAQFTYTDLLVAVQARAQLKTRNNELTDGWITYRDEFAHVEQTQLFPSSDPAVEDEAIQDYIDARDARQEAELAVTAAEAEVTEASDDIAQSQSTLEIYQAQEAYLVEYQGHIAHYATLVINEGSEAVTYRTNTINTSLTNELAAVRSKVQLWVNTKATQQQVYEEAVQTKIAADQELAAAQVAEDEALAAALAANPDFNPNSV